MHGKNGLPKRLLGLILIFTITVSVMGGNTAPGN